MVKAYKVHYSKFYHKSLGLLMPPLNRGLPPDLPAVGVESSDQIGCQHVCGAALDMMAFNHMDQLPIFEKGHAGRRGRKGKHQITSFIDRFPVISREGCD